MKLPAPFLTLTFFAMSLSLSAETPDLPKIIAHRGASHAAPENTLAAFKLAWEEGADGIEGDFRLTRDGEVVCIHDEHTKRTAGRKLSVAGTDWSELAKLDVGRWKDERFAGERIPRLGEVLAILPADKWFFIEIKAGPEIVAPIERILADRHANPERVVLIAFEEQVVARCRELLPKYESHLISKLAGKRGRSGQATCDRALAATDATGLQFDCRAKVQAEWLRGLRQRGLKLASWTVDDPAVARRLIATGIDFLTSNRPAALREELQDAS